MTIDLKWLLPFVLPFALLLLLRGMFYAAGTQWNGDVALGVVLTCFFLGLAGGASMAVSSDKVFPVTLWRHKQ